MGRFLALLAIACLLLFLIPFRRGVLGRPGESSCADGHQCRLPEEANIGTARQSLESQCLGPLSDPLVMTVDDHFLMLLITTAVKRIGKIPGYRPLFKRAFGTEECTIKNLSQAIATLSDTALGNWR